MPQTHTYKTLFKEGSVDYKDYSRIITKVQKRILEDICAGKLVALPFFLGRFFVGGKKTPTFKDDGRIALPINWGATEKLWRERPELRKKQYVYLEDTHTDGYRYKIYWSPIPRTKNKDLYKFKTTYVSSQALKEAIFNGAQFIRE